MRDDAPWWAPPLLALQFLTRLPVPWLDRLSAEQARRGLARAAGWLPLVGGLIGAGTAAVYAGASLLWPPIVAVIVALMVEARLTGAFHEDAVADFCDAFGGGYTAEDVRRIMKDSRIGSYGALGLALALGLRAGATAALPAALAWPAIIGAAAFARLAAVAVMVTVPPAPGGPGLAKDIGRPPRGTLALALVTAAPGLAWLACTAPVRSAAAVAAGLILLVWFGRLLRRRIGGSTGDCLGFAAYAAQLVLLLACAAR